ncbi:MAG: sulfite exporter TauE/SafE family protein, partial [Flavobacteriaceae bacterium]|nr:sulfite exporter TauE/SafE family protein [Flavobacteriaceae bacterium]
PCGLVYAAVFGSLAAQHQLEAAAFMAVFGLGTLPMMFGLFYFSGVVKKRFNSKKLITVFVALIGILFILRGLGLGIPFISPAPNLMAEPGAIECH